MVATVEPAVVAAAAVKPEYGAVQQPGMMACAAMMLAVVAGLVSNAPSGR